MKTLLIPVVAAVAALVGQAGAQAQHPAKVVSLEPTYGYQSTYWPRRSGPYNHHWHHHASTAAEGYARGIAAMIYAQGAYNQMTAEAMILAEEARSRNIANREQATATYFAMRESNREARAAERGPRASAEQLTRLARQEKPNRLAADELNPTTGRVSWPALLQESEYASHKMELDYVLAKRAVNGKIGLEEQARALQATQAMLAELKEHVREVHPMEYTAARQFIERLAYETQLSVG